LPSLEKAFRLSPRDPQLGQWYRNYGTCLLDLHQYKESVEWLQRALLSDPARQVVYRNLAAYLQLRPQASLTADRVILEGMFHPSARSAVDHVLDGLSKAGLPE
jgi:hypothetical protein